LSGFLQLLAADKLSKHVGFAGLLRTSKTPPVWSV